MPRSASATHGRASEERSELVCLFSLIGVLVTFGLTAFGAALYVLGGAGLPRPNLHRWIKENKPAIEASPLLALLRWG